MNRGMKIFQILLLAFAVFAFSRCGERILSKDKVADIMYEMFVVDEYAKTYTEVNLAADSILLYQHIFDKYGCTLEDYQRSIRHYLQDEKEFTYILDRATVTARDNAAEAGKLMGQDKPRLYFPVPYKAPDFRATVNDWWNKNLQGEKIQRDKFYQEMRRIQVIEKDNSVPENSDDKAKKEMPSFDFEAR